MESVDLALVLAADASASVTFEEFGLIAGGMAAALRDKEVAAALTAKGSLVTVLLFSDPASQDVAVDWTRVGNAAEVSALADRIEAIPRVLKPGLTAVGDALNAADALLRNLPAQAARRIVDVAGDGRANAGTSPGSVRNRMVADGITINALCVLHEEPDLLETATRDIIGGPGCFAQTCASYSDFADAMRRKLLREALIALA